MDYNIYHNIPVDRLHPHPDNPRKDLGDLTELADSIKANGIMQNLTVVIDDPSKTITDYTVIIGHRRLAAAKLAGLTEVPCFITEMDEKTQLTTMLAENMQRSDLTVYEQAQGFQMMIDLGATVEEVAEKSGFSQSTVRKRLEIAKLDQKKVKQATEERQITLADFEKLTKIESVKDRNRLLDKIGTYNFDNAVKTAIVAQHRKKVLPLIRKEIKALGIAEIQSSDRWSSAYHRFASLDYDRWNPGDDIGTRGRTDILYFEGAFGTIEYYERKKSEKKSKSAKEIEREKAIKEAHDLCKEIAARHYQLRKDFVSGINVTAKNIDLVARGGVIVLSSSILSYDHASSLELKDFFGIDADGVLPYQERCKQIVKAAAEIKDRNKMLEFSYLAFGDSENMKCNSTYSSDYPRYDYNITLVALYSWLQLFGYEMSDEERAMLDGTHEVLHRGDKQ